MNLFNNFQQRLQNKINLCSRKLTASQRVLPNCLIIGAQKAGTSSLYHYLVQHPQAHKSLKKEIHYFDGGLQETKDTFLQGENWYRYHFPLKSDMKKNDISIDATPMYLFNPLAPARIKKLLPKAKLIILLRNPVERAISHYFHVQRHGFEELEIEEAMAQEEPRLKEIKQSENYKDPAFRLYSYQHRGLYLEQIKRYQALFNDKQLLILSSDDLFQHPKNSLKQVFRFLDIDDSYQVADLKSQNVGNNKEKVPAETYQRLQEYFQQANKELFQHIKKDYPW
ncbi:MAG: sulfotransferase domain-containing protein [Colwellia sp.]|nr:sulfotransferase domain-containing protein [Colwellia sp.]